MARAVTAWLGLAARNVDDRNMSYLARDVLTPRGGAAAVGAAGVQHRGRRWRTYWLDNDQGPTPRCTAFGSLTALHCLLVTHRPRPVVDPQTLYEEIQAVDRAEGRDYGPDGGATTLAAMKALQRRGLIGEYRWEYTLEGLELANDTQVVILGSNWYDSMDRRDRAALPASLRRTPQDGVCRITPAARVDGGHLYCVNARHGELWRIEQTWGDGVYWIPSEDLARLLEREEGEAAVIRELPT